MRIRNRTRQSSAHVPIERATPQTNVCELNRSPWDVHPLVMDFSPLQLHHRPFFIQEQVSRKESMVGKKWHGGSEVVSAGVVLLQPARETEENEQDGKAEVIEDKEGYLTAGVYMPGGLTVDSAGSGSQFPAGRKMKKNRKRVSSKTDLAKKPRKSEVRGIAGKIRSPKLRDCCKKNDGKGWQCRREVKIGHSLCEHHLSQMRSYYHSGSRKSAYGDPAVVAVGGCSRNRKKRSDSGGNYYYYTGFGPSWRKRSGVGRKAYTAAEATVLCKNNDVGVDDNDNHDQYDDEGSEDGDTNRERKPMKARSLKSLLCNSMSLVNKNYYYDDARHVDDNSVAAELIKMEVKDGV